MRALGLRPLFPVLHRRGVLRARLPARALGLTHWRGRIGDKLELLLQESLRLAHDTGALEMDDLSRITVDTTVQPKNVTHPTDAKLMLKAIEQLGGMAKRHSVALRQSYARVARRAALMSGRYTHAKRFKRANRALRFLRTHLGRLTRDIARKTKGDARLGEIFEVPLRKAQRIRWQRQIGHMKTDGHLGRNFLKGYAGDQANAVLTAVGHNFRLILSWLRLLLRLLLAIIVETLSPSPRLRAAS